MLTNFFFILKINKVTIILKTCVLFAPPFMNNMDDILTQENKKLYVTYEVCFKVQLIRYIMTRIALR